jgi:hypothetical protein
LNGIENNKKTKAEHRVADSKTMDIEGEGMLTESAEFLIVQLIPSRGSYLDGKQLSRRVAFVDYVVRKRRLERSVVCD